jgi:hypothetical protein
MEGRRKAIYLTVMIIEIIYYLFPKLVSSALDEDNNLSLFESTHKLVLSLSKYDKDLAYQMAPKFLKMLIKKSHRNEIQTKTNLSFGRLNIRIISCLICQCPISYSTILSGCPKNHEFCFSCLFHNDIKPQDCPSCVSKKQLPRKVTRRIELG